MPRSDTLVDALAVFVDAQAGARDRIAGNVLAQTARLWDLLVEPGDRGATAAFVEHVLALVQAGQRQTADVTASYLRMQLEQTPDAADHPRAVSLPASLRGVDDPAAPYRRPLAQWAGELARGTDAATARDKARQRLLVMVDSDLTAAMREGARQTVAEHPDVIGMRRIVRPELSRGGTCGLCVAAADRIYRPHLLMPIHARDNCETAPVTRSHDPGATLNSEDFALLYANGTAAAELARTRFVVHSHGEQGPVLRRAGDAFRGPDDVAA